MHTGMARYKKSPEPEYSILGIEVTSYIARIDSSINHYVRDQRHRTSETKVYRFYSYIEVEGIANYPDDRLGEQYKLTIFGHEPEPGMFSSKLSDYRAYDENGAPKYRKVRGQETLVYDEPKKIGYLDRQYRSKDWSGAVWVAPHIVTDMLTLLPHVRPIYIQIHVQKVDRNNRIIGLMLQTVNPAEE